MKSSALDVVDVTKTYDQRAAVSHLSFHVETGEVFGLLGPNGSGKTTTIRVALSLIRQDSGTVTLLGETDARRALHRVGYLPEERGLYQRSKVSETLAYLGRLKGLDAATAKRRTDELLQLVGLFDHRQKKVQALSRGMAQLAQFAGTLLHDPALIILDEPFSGLDPLNVQLMKDILLEHRSRGATIIFSTHHMPDVEELCERVLLINEGQSLLYGQLSALKKARKTHRLRVQAPREPTALPPVLSSTSTNGRFEYLLPADAEPNQILTAFLDEHIPVEHYEIVVPSLNEIFIDEVSRARAS